MSERGKEFPEIVYRPAQLMFESKLQNASAIEVLRLRHPSHFAFMARSYERHSQAARSLEQLCSHFAIPEAEFRNLINGIKVKDEQVKCQTFAAVLRVEPEELFPPDTYPWLYCDPESIAEIPDYYVRYRGRVINEPQHDHDDSGEMDADQPEAVEMSDKLLVAREWTLLFDKLEAAERKDKRRSTAETQKLVQEARSAFESVCLALARQVAQEYKPENSSPEDATQDAYVALLEAQQEYDDHATELVTFVRARMLDALQAVDKDEKRRRRVATRSLDAALTERFRVSDDEENPDGTEGVDAHEELLHPSDETPLSGEVSDVVPSGAQEAIENVDTAALRAVLEEIIESFTERRREVLKHRFELFGYEYKTYEELVAKLGFTRALMMQDEATVISKLQGRNNARELEKFL